MTERLKTFINKNCSHYARNHNLLINQVPRIEKVINRGLGDASQNAKILQSSLDELSIMPVNGVLTRSKAIAAFKLRKKHQ
jgi:large subunit ribosomal protein L5